MKRIFFSYLVLLSYVVFAQHQTWQGPSVLLTHGNLKVHENKRFLTFEDGTPFFIWEILVG